MYILQSILYVPIILILLFFGGLTYTKRRGPGVGDFSAATFVIALWLAWQALAQLNISDYYKLIWQYFEFFIS